jgi:putative transposase
LDDNTDKSSALNIGKRALGKFSKPLPEAEAVLVQSRTQVIVHRDDDPANLSVSVGSTLSGGTPRLEPWKDVSAIQMIEWGGVKEAVSVPI